MSFLISNINLLNIKIKQIIAKCSINRTSFNQIVQVHNENRRGVFARDHGPRGNQYKPYVNKRIQTYGLATRLQSRGGKQMLWRKIIKGPKGWIGLGLF
jgi:hypothetical protein